IGVTYYDFRPNTPDRSTLLAAHWLARSDDATTWRETQVAGPFDLDLAPLSTTSAAGLFLGDYQSLSSVGTTFMPMFVQTNAGDANNRTDVFIAPAVSVPATSSGAAVAKALTVANADAMQAFLASPQWRARVSDNIALTLRGRL